MKAYFYHRGEFTEREVDWRDGEDWEHWLERNGFCEFATESDEYSYAIHMASSKAEQALGVAIFALGSDRVANVVAVDQIDYLDVYARWMPALHGAELKYQLENIETAIERAFRAWHGHKPEDACPECDPEEARRRSEYAAKLRAKKLTKC